MLFIFFVKKTFFFSLFSSDLHHFFRIFLQISHALEKMLSMIDLFTKHSILGNNNNNNNNNNIEN